jgi:hypothetical protein
MCSPYSSPAALSDTYVNVPFNVRHSVLPSQGFHIALQSRTLKFSRAEELWTYVRRAESGTRKEFSGHVRLLDTLPLFWHENWNQTAIRAAENY